jgi:hypothetical protein
MKPLRVVNDEPVDHGVGDHCGCPMFLVEVTKEDNVDRSTAIG